MGKAVELCAMGDLQEIPPGSGVLVFSPRLEGADPCLGPSSHGGTSQAPCPALGANCLSSAPANPACSCPSCLRFPSLCISRTWAPLTPPP